MQVYEAIKTLLAVRDYQDKAVPEGTIRQILEAARLTASSQNRQDWDFVLVTDRQRLQQLGNLASSGGYIAQAAFAVAVLVGDYRSAPADGGRAVQDMMLAAWAEGIGSNWVGNVSSQEIRDLLNVPESRTVLTIVPFGYPKEELGAGVKDRKPFSDIVHLDRYGHPFDSQT